MCATRLNNIATHLMASSDDLAGDAEASDGRWTIGSSLHGPLICANGSRLEELAAATLFITWGSNNRAALDDIDGAGYQGWLDGGYQDLAESIDLSRRVVLTWCWELYFSMPVVVPGDVRSELLARLTSYVEPLRPWLERLTVQ